MMGREKNVQRPPSNSTSNFRSPLLPAAIVGELSADALIDLHNTDLRVSEVGF